MQDDIQTLLYIRRTKCKETGKWKTLEFLQQEH